MSYYTPLVLRTGTITNNLPAPLDMQYTDRLTRKLKQLSSLWLVKEFVIIHKLAVPNILSYILESLITFTTVIFAGNIGKEDKYLDGSSIAISFAVVTGIIISIGLSSGIETLCSQSYGAKQYKQSGLYFQKSLLIHFLLCFPLAGVWLNAENIMLILHQNSEVAQVAAEYMSIYCLALPAIQISFLSLKLFQAHNFVLPQIMINLSGLIANIVGQYILVVYLKLGVKGSATTLTLSQYVIAVGFILYIRFSHLYKQTWCGWRAEALYDWYHYLKYGVPGMLMLCFESWSFESGYFSVGAFAPFPKVELGIYSVAFQVAGVVFSIPLGYMVSGTVRIGNLLGHNEPQNAKHSSYLLYVIIFVTGTTQFVVIYSTKTWLVTLFTTDTCILAGAIWPLSIVAVFQIFDGFQAVAGGILKGCGKQALGAIINIFTFQFISLPLAFYLAFGMKWYTSGFWTGLAVGILIHGVGYGVALWFVDWNKTSKIARENAGVRIVADNSSGSDCKDTFTPVARIGDRGYLEMKFVIAIRLLTLLLFVLFLALGVIIREFQFTISFYETDNSNYTHCHYD